jgi:predicted nucleic acid-binding protein
MTRYVLDTNILAAFLRDESEVVKRISEAAQANAEFLLCPIVFYEILRGLLHRGAKTQLQG